MKVCHAQRQRMRCFAPGCQELSNPLVWNHTCTRIPEVGTFQHALVRRRGLQQNALYPAAVQVDCPRRGCIGLGYLGFETVMCFLCEHSWSGRAGDPEGSNELQDCEVLVKCCPSCNVPISKNGGCDHMTCVCGHQFWWTTLKAYGTR